ncbi:MAG: molecular chaperone HtpG [Bacteroidetes bacterium]|nr:molecular chaperone HtpG [Bacteroidota bacterium]
MSENTQQFEYKAEMQQLLHLIINSLYTNQEIFLRELISNASDALNKARFQGLTDHSGGDHADLKITITVDKDAKTLSVEDTGIGMTQTDLTERLGTIASSGTLAFIEEQKSSGKPVDAGMIGQFGVGFYSAFMVADHIEIETLHCSDDAEPLTWTSDATGTYTIGPSTRSEPGTKITLHLKEDASEFSDDYRVRSIIRKYSNFVDFPIYLDSDQINTLKALWKKRKDDINDEELSEFYKFISGDYNDPLGHLHLQIEGLLTFDALLFIPSQAPLSFFREDRRSDLHLYSSGVFVRDDAEELLPEYLAFVRGVVDTDDLPLNVSREVTQNSPVTQRIRSTLTGKLLGLLDQWATEDVERYEKFFLNFGVALKTGLFSDQGKQDELLKLVRYPSTSGEHLTSLSDYVTRMPDSQESIYYLLSDSLESARKSPHLEVFTTKGIEVLLLTDPIDALTLPNVPKFEDKKFINITTAELDLTESTDSESLPGDEIDSLLTLFRVQLGDRVQDVTSSKRLVDSAATLVTAKDGMDPQLERMMKSMNPEYEGVKKVLEINASHPLMKNLLALKSSSENQGSLIEQTIEQIYEGALLLDGNLTEPSSFVSRMTSILVDATREPSSTS